MTKKKCVHYWKIESPDGETSTGTCAYCGETREFFNHWPTFPSPYHPFPGNVKKYKDGTTQHYDARISVSG